MKEKLNTESIGQMLERSSARLDQPTLARLREARELALARYDAHSPSPAFAWAGTLTGSGHGTQRSHYYWAAAVLLAACLFSAAYWKHATENEASDVDIAILTDELPIDVYVD